MVARFDQLRGISDIGFRERLREKIDSACWCSTTGIVHRLHPPRSTYSKFSGIRSSAYDKNVSILSYDTRGGVLYDPNVYSCIQI